MNKTFLDWLKSLKMLNKVPQTYFYTSSKISKIHCQNILLKRFKLVCQQNHNNIWTLGRSEFEVKNSLTFLIFDIL